MTKALEFWGWVYIISSTLGAAILWANSKVSTYSEWSGYSYKTSPEIILYGFAVLLQGIMVFTVFLALAKILKKLDG